MLIAAQLDSIGMGVNWPRTIKTVHVGHMHALANLV